MSYTEEDFKKLTKAQATARISCLVELIQSYLEEATGLAKVHQLDFRLIDGREGGVWFTGYADEQNKWYEDHLDCVGWHNSSEHGRC
jgi:hypothetical protein